MVADDMQSVFEMLMLASPLLLQLQSLVHSSPSEAQPREKPEAPSEGAMSWLLLSPPHLPSDAAKGISRRNTGMKIRKLILPLISPSALLSILKRFLQN